MGSLIANAVLFFGFIAMKLRPAVKTGLVSRRDNMAVALKEAEEKQMRAEEKLREYDKKLANLEGEVERIVESYRTEAEKDRAKMEEETKNAISRLARESDFTIEQEVKKAQASLRAATANATLTRAEKLIQEQMTGTDRQKLIVQAIVQIASGKAAISKA